VFAKKKKKGGGGGAFLKDFKKNTNPGSFEKFF